MPTESCFDFIFIPADGVSATLDLGTLGEQLGYRCMWIPDQEFHRDPFAIQALAAERTSTMGIGIGITSPWTRLPVQIARGAATIAEIAPGRLRLGLGTGNIAHVLRPLGLRAERPAQRLEDSIRIIRSLLRGETVSFDVEFDYLSDVKLAAEAAPDVPIYVGTRAPRTLEMAGRAADGVLPEAIFNAGGLAYVHDRVGRGATAAGRAVAEIDIVAWQLVAVTDDPLPVIRAHKGWIARSLQVGPPELMERIGVDPNLVAHVALLMDSGETDRAIAAVTDHAVLCHMLIGTADQLVNRIEQIFEAGATALCVLGIGSASDIAENLNRFSSEVMPAFSGRKRRQGAVTT
jgi:5,10-methylenetetrahydromethanopterin reductase